MRLSLLFLGMLLLCTNENPLTNPLDFHATKDGKLVQLEWKASGSHDARAFRVFRSTDDQEYSDLGWLKAFESGREGDAYTYLDPMVGNLVTDTVYYKLIGIVEGSGPTEMGRAKVFLGQVDFLKDQRSHPINFDRTIVLNLPEKGEYRIKVIDQTAQVLWETIIQADVLRQTLKLPSRRWSVGVYDVELEHKAHHITRKVELH